MKSAIQDSQDIISSIHVPEVEKCIKAVTKADLVRIISFSIRKRHADFPVQTNATLETWQPVLRVHIDTTHDCIRSTIIPRVWKNQGSPMAVSTRWQCINIWHPLRGPLIDWPLALCDASSVDFRKDTMAGDIVDPDEVFENTQVHHNANQRWYYLHNQLPTELLMFKNADSLSERGMAAPGVPHASFNNPNFDPASDVRRESIELCALVFWL